MAKRRPVPTAIRRGGSVKVRDGKEVERVEPTLPLDHSEHPRNKKQSSRHKSTKVSKEGGTDD